LFKLPSKQKAWIYANAYFDNWLMEINNIEEYTLYGSCVSVAALKMCYTWGCKSVALIGQDLSFKANKYYAGSTFAPEYIIEAFDESSKSPLYKLPGYYGGEVITKNDYRVYHGQFEQLAEEINEKTKVSLYNCTEGGANIKGFENIPLIEFIKKALSPSGKASGTKSIVDIIAALDHSIDKPKIRSNLIKTKRLLTEVENLLSAAIKKTSNSMESAPNEERSVQTIQKKIARKIKNSMFLKMALQDPLSSLAESEKYQNNREGLIKKGNEMYKACLEVVVDLKLRISKIKV
jgi:hypothetical protein